VVQTARLDVAVPVDRSQVSSALVASLGEVVGTMSSLTSVHLHSAADHTPA